MVPGAILKHINGKYLEEFGRGKWSEWCWELGGVYTHRCPLIIWLWQRVRVDTICIELKVGSCGLGKLEWVSMPSSRTSSQPRDQTCVSCGSCIASGFFTVVPPGKPIITILCCAVLCLVTQSYLTLWDSMDCNPPGSSVCGESLGKNTGVGCHSLLQGIFPTQGLNLGLLHCRWLLHHLSHQGSPNILEWVAYPFSRGSSQPRNQTRVSGIIGRLFTISAILWPHGLQHTRPPCPSPSPRASSNSCPLSWWWHPTISSPVTPFSSCLQSFPAFRVFSNESDLCIRWPKYWSFSFSISPSNEYSGLISFRINWFDLLAV